MALRTSCRLVKAQGRKPRAKRQAGLRCASAIWNAAATAWERSLWTSSDPREWTFSEETTEESGVTIRSASWLADGAGVAVSLCGPAGQFDSVCVTMDESG